MAQRRMFSSDITSSDAFMEMSQSAQALYFHLGMRADDDGFVNPIITMRMLGANTDDLKILIAKRFLFHFQNGVVVVKHWRINNFIRKDRYKPTNYIEEKAQLNVKENMAYTLDKNQGKPLAEVEWKSDAQVRLSVGQPLVNAGEDRIGKDRIGKESKPTASIEFLRTVPKEFLDTFSQEYGISPKGIQSKATDLNLWCESKGKVYKNYKSFLENAIRKDQVQLRSQFPARVAPQVNQSVKEASEMSSEQIEQNKTRIAAMSADLAETFRGA